MTRLIRNSLCTSTYFVRTSILALAILDILRQCRNTQAAAFTVNSTADATDTSQVTESATMEPQLPCERPLTSQLFRQHIISIFRRNTPNAWTV